MKKILFFLTISILLISCKKYDISYMTIGDSITFLDGNKFPTGPHKGERMIGYQTVINQLNNNTIKIDNKGYSGFSLAGHERSIYQEIKGVNFKNQNVITIFAGTNDFKLNKPIVSNDSLESFRYCYTSLITKIQRQNKNAHLYLITPLKRDNDGYNIFSKNKVGLKLVDYRNEVVRIGYEYKIDVIDLYNESEINETNLNKFTIDGLHPNNAGYEIIGNELNQKIFSPLKNKISYQ